MSKRVRGFEVVSSDHRKHDGNIITPTRADKGSCGYDFYSPIDFEIKPQERFTLWTDIKSYMPSNECLDINIRSSIGIKKGCVLSNTIGWIDSSYYDNESNDGNIGICLFNTSKETQCFKKGERIAQGKFLIFLTTDDDNILYSNRVGGVGSSGA